MLKNTLFDSYAGSPDKRYTVSVRIEGAEPVMWEGNAKTEAVQAFNCLTKLRKGSLFYSVRLHDHDKRIENANNRFRMCLMMDIPFADVWSTRKLKKRERGNSLKP